MQSVSARPGPAMQSVSARHGPKFRYLSHEPTITAFFEGEAFDAPENVSVAAALLLAGLPAGRWSGVTHAQRSVYCGIGQCFDCTMTIDGVSGRQACMTRIQAGMRIERQIG